MKVLTVILVAFLLSIQAQIWFGKGGLSRVVQLESQLARQQAANQQARARNDQIEAELLDLREGLEMVEEKARSELDMVKPDEIYVQVMGMPKPAASANAAGGQPMAPASPRHTATRQDGTVAAERSDQTPESARR